jgi:hypothetical protein
MDEKIRGYCDRCCKPATITIMSKFNKDVICIPCKEEEKLHHKYKEASDVELAECKKGNYNFEGIGLPDDLQLKYSINKHRTQ